MFIDTWLNKKANIPVEHSTWNLKEKYTNIIIISLSMDFTLNWMIWVNVCEDQQNNVGGSKWKGNTWKWFKILKPAVF